MADEIVDNTLPSVFRNEEFFIELPVEFDTLAPFDGSLNPLTDTETIIDSIVLRSVGTQDIGITLSTENNRPTISGKYESIHDDNILYVNKGEATRLQLFEYDDSQPDGFAKDLNGENIPLDTPLPLSDEKFAEEKLKFPALVQPTKITSIEQLPLGQDLVLAQQDPRETITAQYELIINFKSISPVDGSLSPVTQNFIYEQTVKNDIAIFGSILQTYYTTGIPAALPYTAAVNIVTPITEPEPVVDRIFELKQSTTNISAGESFIITLSTNISFSASFGPNFGIQTLVSIPYTITGIDTGDIESVNNAISDNFLFSFETLTGNFVFGGNDVSSGISVKIKNNLTTEGNKTFVLTLDNHPELSTSVVILDPRVIQEPIPDPTPVPDLPLVPVPPVRLEFYTLNELEFKISMIGGGIAFEGDTIQMQCTTRSKALYQPAIAAVYGYNISNISKLPLPPSMSKTREFRWVVKATGPVTVEDPFGEFGYSYRGAAPVILEGKFIFSPGSNVSNIATVDTQIDNSTSEPQGYRVFIPNEGTVTALRDENGVAIYDPETGRILSEKSPDHVSIHGNEKTGGTTPGHLKVLLLDDSFKTPTSVVSQAGSNPVTNSIMLDENGVVIYDENGVALNTINMNQTVAQFDAKLDAH